MLTIGLVDDRDVDRGMIVDAFRLQDNSDKWEIVDIKPFLDINQYPSWISQNKICVLIVDERLDEELFENGMAVSYKGHLLIDYIRSRFKTIPVFVITNYPSDDSLSERFKDVEGIINRTDFSTNKKDYIPRIIRSAQQYLDMFQEELKELADYAYKIAIGERISEKECEHIDAIKFKLNSPYMICENNDISQWLEKANELLAGIEKLQKEIEGKIKD